MFSSGARDVVCVASGDRNFTGDVFAICSTTLLECCSVRLTRCDVCVCCVEWRQVRPDVAFSRHAFVHLRRFMRLKPSNMSARATDVNADQSLACATRAMNMFLT